MKLIILFITLVIISVSAFITVKKRKEADHHSKKSWITPICLHLAPIVALITFTYERLGGIGFLLLGVLFITAAYYSKYQP